MSPLIAPEDIAMITKEWRLRDSNYSRICFIGGKGRLVPAEIQRSSVDTVIAVNQSAIAGSAGRPWPGESDRVEIRTE